MSFVSLNSSDFVVSADSITSTLFSGEVPTLTQFFTSSQTSSFDTFLDALLKNRINFFSGVPDSCLSGLIDFDSGQINYQKSYDVKKINYSERLNHISKFGVLFQNAALFDSLTIRENIMFKKKSLNINSVLNDVGLDSSCLDLFPSDLSVGMQKRVGLARAISAEPEILILDEPTTGLHSHDIKKLLEILQAFANTGNTVVVIEHNLDVIKTADHIIDMGPEGGVNGGKIIAEGTPEKVSTVKESYTGKFIKGIMGNSSMKKTA